MNRRSVIRISFVIVAILWLTVFAMPHRFQVMRNLAAVYYDRRMEGAQYRLQKEQDQLTHNKNASEEEKLDATEALAKSYWTFFKSDDARRLLEEVRNKREKLHPEYSQKLTNTLLLLAAVYRDLNQLIPSAECYERVWNLDKENLAADDSRLLRDQTNLALIDYIRGDSDKDEKVRNRFFKSSIAHIQEAKRLWHKQKDPDTAALANIFYLEYLTNREIGNDNVSRQAYGEMKYLNKLLKRPYSPPWT